MSASTNINKVYFNGKTSAYAERVLYQWDYGQILQLPDLQLPSSYQVHFANQPAGGQAYVVLGDENGVPIPDTLLTTGLPINAWVFLQTGEDDGETCYKVFIPVTPRPKPSEETPTPAQQSALDKAIAALNTAAAGVPGAIAAALAEAKASGEFDGPPGRNGQDGYSPVVTVTSITGGHRVTITDEDHPDGQSFDVMDGAGGGSNFVEYGTGTNAQIEAFYQAEQMCACIRDGMVILPLVDRFSSTYHVFSAAYNNTVYIAICQNNEWRAVTRELAKLSDIPTKTSDLQNDSGFLTQHQDISGKADKVTEVTVSNTGDVTQALDAGKAYHFTGALTALTITLNAAASGQRAQYHFDFESGATAPTVTIPASVTMPAGFQVEANKRYEIDILDGYGVAQSWEVSSS